MIHGGQHIKIYKDYFNIINPEDVCCEITGTSKVQVCHIDASGMGGRQSTNVIENLMAMNPIIHDITEGRYKEDLRQWHAMYMERRVPMISVQGWSSTAVGSKILMEYYSRMHKKINRYRWKG